MVTCPKCGSKNSDDAKFCKKCGQSLKGTPKIQKHETPSGSNRTIIIAAIAVAIIVLAGIGVYASGILGGVPLENRDFDYFSIDVPKESDFELDNAAYLDDKHMVVMYKNSGKYSSEAEQIAVGVGLEDVLKNYVADESDGDIQVYKNRSGDSGYGVYAKNGKAELFVVGSDVSVLKNMAKSFREGDLDKLKKSNTSTASVSSVAAPSSMTINGGSFSTGSSLSDKTYAKIYVGPEHAGESVTIQIKYSRDGSSLNNGNMVPKTVSSEGYIEVSSADSYKYYPDYAEISLYDSSGNLLDTQSVSLSPSSGTQNF